MLICLVGPDGAGKSTLSRMLAGRLEEGGLPVEHVDRWDIVGNPAYPSTRFMRNDVPDTRLCVAEMPNPSRFLFLMWSISLALLGKDGGSSTRAPVRLLDGYWMKHAASEAVYGLDRRWIESVVAGLPRPDRVLYLRVEPDVAWERKKDGDVVPYECGMDASCSRESFVRHQRRILEVLDSWADAGGWEVVDASRPVPQVLAELEGLAASLPAPVAVAP